VWRSQKDGSKYIARKRSKKEGGHRGSRQLEQKGEKKVKTGETQKKVEYKVEQDYMIFTWERAEGVAELSPGLFSEEEHS